MSGAVQVRFAPEGEGEMLAIDGEMAKLICNLAFAPGTPLVFAAGVGGEQLLLSGKSRGCKRRADGRFDLMVRLTDLRRAQRQALRRMLDD